MVLQKSGDLKSVNIQSYVSTKEGVRNVMGIKYTKHNNGQGDQAIAGVAKFRANTYEVIYRRIIEGSGCAKYNV